MPSDQPLTQGKFIKILFMVRLAGLALVYSLQITQFLGFMVQQSVEAETQMNSVERIVSQLFTLIFPFLGPLYKSSK